MDTEKKMKRMREVELLVVGAGPAGLGAAIEASSCIHRHRRPLLEVYIYTDIVDS